MTDRLSSLRQLGRCAVVGILNVTPDSFSDGGRYHTPRAAVAHAVRMVADGADYVDVGGESTRPGAARISVDEERRRVLPVVSELCRLGLRVSIDTSRASIAAAAVDAGAVLINDVSGGLADPDMATVVANADVPWVLTHWRGPSIDMYVPATYSDVVAEVRRDLLDRVEAAVASGVRTDQLIVDPGFGFAKLISHDVEIMRNLSTIVELGLPVLIGTSRKRFLGSLLATHNGSVRAPRGRDAATVATSVLAAQEGVWGVRVHEVAATADALQVMAAVTRLPGAPTQVIRPNARRRRNDGPRRTVTVDATASRRGREF